MIKMIGSRILIEEIVEDIKSEGGIILGETRASAQRGGKVVSIGNLVQEVSLGDKVLFDGHRVASLDFDGNTYLILEENNIIGVYL